MYKTASKASRDVRRYKERVKEVLTREKKLKHGISNLDWLESEVNRATAEPILDYKYENKSINQEVVDIFQKLNRTL